MKKMSWIILITVLIAVVITSTSGSGKSVPMVKFVRQSDSGAASTPPTKIPDCSGTCEFTNSVASISLMSCDGSCVCIAKVGPMYSPSWNVVWNGTICTISESGPCGKGERGMVMACHPDLNCVEKRCREPSRIGSLEAGWACDDSLDCQSGLACVSDENVIPLHKTCRVLPKSLFRIW